MTAKKQKSTQHDGEKTPHNANEDALHQAEKDMGNDPEFSEPDPTDDLDEGELARKDNSDEDAFDAFGK
jgi:hypothetical protein